MLFAQRQLPAAGLRPVTVHSPQPGEGGPGQSRLAVALAWSLMSASWPAPFQPLSRSATVEQRSVVASQKRGNVQSPLFAQTWLVVLANRTSSPYPGHL